MAWRRRVPDRIVNEPVLCIIPAEEPPFPDAHGSLPCSPVVVLQVRGEQFEVEALVRLFLGVLVGDDVLIDIMGVDTKTAR